MHVAIQLLITTPTLLFQKCDRKHPCSLCITRGVAHLCRWESVPVARPAPARPPAGALREASVFADDQTQLITDLTQRIASLENELKKAREQPSPPYLSLTSGSLSTSPSSNATDVSTSGNFSPYHDHLSELSHRPSPEEQVHEYTILSARTSPEILPIQTFPMDDAAYEATSTIAHLSLAHHGEFIGRGSLICALHSVTSRKVPRFLYAKSTDAMSEYREPAQKFSNISFIGTIDELVSYLPPMLVVETLTSAFFFEVNWRYAIPEDWFRRARSQMWMSLQHSTGSQINTNWLMLLFAILAVAPQSAYEEIKHYSATRSSDDYFMCAMMARRMVEDEYLSVPSASLMVSAADGTVLGCLATPLLCDYLAERGRVSEAWKLAGIGIRNAEAVGMHRDPEWKLWQMMSADEKVLRRRAWWGLFITDKTYSYVLARPQILRPEIYDVELPSAHNPDGSRNLVNFGQNVFISLMEMLCDAIEKCFNVNFPDCLVFLEMDRKFEDWEERLPMEYQLGCEMRLLQEFNPSELKLLACQRYLIHTWYMIGRLRFHIASSTDMGRAPQSSAQIRHSMEKCISISLQMIRFQCAVYGSFSHPSDNSFAYVYPGSCWLFEGCFSLFEASVALITTMAQLRMQEKVAEASSAIDSALLVFNQVARREQGKTKETATRAIEVLINIRNQVDSSLPKVKDDPELLDLSMLVNLSKTIGDTSSMANVFASAPQFSLHSMQMRHNDNTQLPQFSQINDFVGYSRENLRMGDHMDGSHMGIERGTTRHL
ncbi:hypothetical protein GALMADRAFT_542955 [Galerina marginata CBS 339.88]|uniref:Xylanolytic transcriptional activator regulatory domain-containing protein n=1 Tax=Galerina marginata (strain CBS 339.88) TaxID=685588 RepID=A0A067T5R9_GALM3|nr:hypothetical protein GALMADRAFT_542955 [Galerina marginata CBS 339.88]